MLLVLRFEPYCSLCPTDWLVLSDKRHECWGPGFSEPAKDIGDDTIPLPGYIIAKLAQVVIVLQQRGLQALV